MSDMTQYPDLYKAYLRLNRAKDRMDSAIEELERAEAEFREASKAVDDLHELAHGQ